MQLKVLYKNLHMNRANIKILKIKCKIPKIYVKNTFVERKKAFNF